MFMENILKLQVLVVLALITFSSCKKQLNTSAPDLITEEKAFSDIAGLERGIVGVYATLNTTVNDREAYANALYSDEAMLPTENTTGRGVQAFRWQTDPGTGDLTQAWVDFYFAIDRVNRILGQIDNVPVNNTSDQSSKNRIKGEALAIRAYAHLQLLINFSNGFSPEALAVPYMETSIISKPSRLTVSQVFSKIRADLNSASGLIPASGLPATFSGRTRITLSVVYAIQARAALYEKRWDDAIAAATAAINSVPLTTITQYPSIWTDASNNEVIWKLKRVSGDGRFGDAFYDRGNIIIYAVSEKLRSTFNTTTDIRYASLVFLRGAGRFSLGKYIGGDPNIPNLADAKIFRTAEMYLIRAEAYAEKDQLANATADINTLLTNRITGYTSQTFATKADVINAVMNERFKELAFEGHRMHDLRRRLLPVNRLAADAINAQGAINLLPGDKVYYWPIPAAEILANENMKQNSGY
jgi:starch-binding outer membrane protein, SusD/RagB family